MRPPLIYPLIAILFCLGLSHCEQQETQIVNQPDRPEPTAPTLKGIVGGTTTNYDSWQPVVGLLLGQQGICTGTLIHPQVVLTAGHCVLNEDAQYGYDFTQNPSRIRIVGGANVLLPSAVSYARGQEIITHPDWDGDLTQTFSDIALIKLDRRIDTLTPYKLRDYPSATAGSQAKLVGYGDALTGGSAGIHRVGDTTLLNIYSGLIETGSPANTCGGDSGGPVFTEQNGEWVIHGVNSFVDASDPDNQCSLTEGAYAVNVLGHCDFLNQAMIDLVGEDLGLEGCTTCKVEPVEEWGAGCGPGFPACPSGTDCMRIADYGSIVYGFCAAPCCGIENENSAHCNDVADGRESCGISDGTGNYYCIINCQKDADCPEYAICKGASINQPGMCMGDASVRPDQNGDSDEETDAGDLDTDDVDTDRETTTGTDEETDSHSSNDSDEPQADSINDTNDDEDDSTTSDCGCRAVFASEKGLLAMILHLI